MPVSLDGWDAVRDAIGKQEVVRVSVCTSLTDEDIEVVLALAEACTFGFVFTIVESK